MAASPHFYSNNSMVHCQLFFTYLVWFYYFIFCSYTAFCTKTKSWQTAMKMHSEYTKSTLEREWVLTFFKSHTSAQLFIPWKKYVQPSKILPKKVYSICRCWLSSLHNARRDKQRVGNYSHTFPASLPPLTTAFTHPVSNIVH